MMDGQPEVFVSSDAYTAAVIIRSNAFDRRWADAEMVAKELLRIIECEGGVIRSPVNHLDANARADMKEDDKPEIVPAADVFYFCWYCMRREPESCDRQDCPAVRYPPPEKEPK